MSRSVLARLLFICAGTFSTFSLLSCSSEERSAAFDLESAKKRWNTSEKLWNLQELISLEHGRVIFSKNCAACHGKEGGGNLAIGAPALVNNAIIKGDLKYHLALIKKGKNLMPSFAQTLNNEEIVDVAAYERNVWGNHDYSVFEGSLD